MLQMFGRGKQAVDTNQEHLYPKGRETMRKKVGVVVVGLFLVGGLSACASKYGIQDGGSHFASWGHLRYSTRGGEKPALTKTEVKQAKAEGWWGTPVAYTIDDLE
jgi:hypothetical protein